MIGSVTCEHLLQSETRRRRQRIAWFTPLYITGRLAADESGFVMIHPSRLLHAALQHRLVHWCQTIACTLQPCFPAWAYLLAVQLLLVSTAVSGVLLYRVATTELLSVCLSPHNINVERKLQFIAYTLLTATEWKTAKNNNNIPLMSLLHTYIKALLKRWQNASILQ